MTDEELLAEEYICNGKCQDDITKDYVHCKTCTRLNDFLAGLKAGRTKWHNVSDGDLPPMYDTGDYLSKNVILDAGIMGYYNYSQKKWCVSMGHRLIKDVIAWCEIPKYTEEPEKNNPQLLKHGTIEVDPVTETFLRGR